MTGGTAPRGKCWRPDPLVQRGQRGGSVLAGRAQKKEGASPPAAATLRPAAEPPGPPLAASAPRPGAPTPSAATARAVPAAAGPPLPTAAAASSLHGAAAPPLAPAAPPTPVPAKPPSRSWVSGSAVGFPAPSESARRTGLRPADGSAPRGVLPACLESPSGGRGRRQSGDDRRRPPPAIAAGGEGDGAGPPRHLFGGRLTEVALAAAPDRVAAVPWRGQSRKWLAVRSDWVHLKQRRWVRRRENSA